MEASNLLTSNIYSIPWRIHPLLSESYQWNNFIVSSSCVKSSQILLWSLFDIIHISCQEVQTQSKCNRNIRIIIFNYKIVLNYTFYLNAENFLRKSCSSNYSQPSFCQWIQGSRNNYFQKSFYLNYNSHTIQTRLLSNYSSKT